MSTCPCCRTDELNAGWEEKYRVTVEGIYTYYVFQCNECEHVYDTSESVEID